MVKRLMLEFGDPKSSWYDICGETIIIRFFEGFVVVWKVFHINLCVFILFLFFIFYCLSSLSCNTINLRMKLFIHDKMLYLVILVKEFS